jgi:hypothetical protein
MYQSVRTTDDEAYGSKEALLDDASSEPFGVWTDSAATNNDRGRKRFLYGSLILNAALATGVALLSVPRLQRLVSDPFNNILIKQVSMPCRSITRVSISLD